MEPPSSSSGPLRELAIRSDRSYSCLGNYNAALDASLDDLDQKEEAQFPSVNLDIFHFRTLKRWPIGVPFRPTVTLQ